jgi:pimeloyl-ACP methyl ester carboxylesterase
MKVDRFRIAIPDAALEDLRARLARTRWPDEVNDDAWSYGMSLPVLRRLVEYWADRFDWRAQEAALNRLPQFRAEIDGLPIHFVHARGVGPKPFPLVLTHGWPGSFIEMRRILPMLTDPVSHGGNAEDAFDVIVPSLPGYGFSGRPTRAGMSPFAIARIWGALMAGLGYRRYGLQGGDWGAAVSLGAALAFPDAVAGLHLNFLPSLLMPTIRPEDRPLSEPESRFLAERAAWLDEEGGYARIQGTKPQTLGYALTDSPVGLAAWILEKFRGWSDCGGDVESVFSRDELLTNISIYWLTGTAASSLRLYREARLASLTLGAGQRVAPPFGFARFPKEISRPPREWTERIFDVWRWTDMQRGGHFAAMEQPALLAEEVREFFRPLRDGQAKGRAVAA